MMPPAVGLVVVSHSRALARAAVALAQEMLHGKQIKITIAAGLDDTTFGTDATQIVDAITAANQGAGVVVLMDLGSAVLSAELAVELVDTDLGQQVVLCPAPLVEGLVVAAVAAAGGADVAEVVSEATGALAGKISQLGPTTQAASDVVGTPQHGEVTGSFVVANPHGLHARPAARLVQEARRRDARALVRNATRQSPWVSAASLSKIATLGVQCGDEVEVRVSGNQAAETLDHIVALAGRHFDESPTATAPIRRPAATPTPIGAAAGLGIGPARSARLAHITIPETPADDPTVEWRRLGTAIAAVRRTITQLRTRTARDVGEAEASIFDAHQLFLDDTELLDDVRRRVDSGATAPVAWSASVSALVAEFAVLSDPYMRARAEDVTAVGDQVLRAMLGSNQSTETTTAGPGEVLIAADLTPAEAAELDPARTAAVLLAYGSPHAHNVILLRAKGIPTVVGAGSDVLDIPAGTTVAVDGSTGDFVVDPAKEVRRVIADKVATLTHRHRQARANAGQPAKTRDGLTIPVGTNVGSVEDARAGASNGADHAGLVRTEFLFLGRTDAPDVEEQVAMYRKIAESLDGKRITLRTLDVGGDKPLQFQPTPTEVNPFLGVRGIRLSLVHPKLLADQLLAMALVAQDTPVSIMFPMVSTLDELRAATAMLDDAVRRAGRDRPRDLEVGMMVEVPAAALKATSFAPHVDFFSIGTNDLTQYALAADRNNDAVAAIGDTFDPGLLHLIRATCLGAGGRASVSVCGEFAADELAVDLLIGLGVRSLSVAAPAIPLTKESVRGVESADAARFAESALSADSAASVRELVNGHKSAQRREPTRIR